MLPLSPEVERLIRAKAEAARQSPDEFLRTVMAAKEMKRGPPDIDGMKKIAREINELPVLDDRTPDAILEDAFGGNETGERRRKRIDIAKAREIIERNRKRPVLDGRSTKEILNDAWKRE